MTSSPRRHRAPGPSGRASVPGRTGARRRRYGNRSIVPPATSWPDAFGHLLRMAQLMLVDTDVEAWYVEQVGAITAWPFQQRAHPDWRLAERGRAFAHAFVEHVAAVERPEALALLRAVAAVEAADVAEPAAAAADRLDRIGVPAQRWFGLLGRAVPTAALVVFDPEQRLPSVPCVEFVHPDGVRHTVVVFPESRWGTIDAVGLTGPLGEAVVQVFGGEPDEVATAPLSLGEAADEWAIAVARTDGVVDLASDDYLRLRPLLHRRLGALRG